VFKEVQGTRPARGTAGKCTAQGKAQKPWLSSLARHSPPQAEDAGPLLVHTVPSFHHSIIPLFHSLIFPLLHYSTTPFFLGFMLSAVSLYETYSFPGGQNVFSVIPA
jgi:hypothetical protein